MKIVILGGGTAGWIAGCMAASLNKMFKDSNNPSSYDVTVIDSSNIPIIGAGEGSTGILTDWISKKFKHLGANEVDFLYETESTLKLGIKFKDWDGVGTEYLSPIQPTYSSMYNVDLDLLSFVVHGKYYESSPAGYLMGNGLSSYYTTKNKTTTTHSYHFDAHKVGQYLKKLAIKNGIKHIDAEVIKVNVNPLTGDCDSVLLKETNETITADLWIDCSGFARIIAKEMDCGWTSYQDFLPTNTAMPYLHKYAKDEDIKLETLAQAMPNGWMWQIPTQQRYGCGYVYCDKFTTADKALEEMETITGRKIEPIRTIKFEAGRLNKFWSKNVISVGLSSGFLEPLQATSIHSTIIQLDLLYNHFLYTDKERSLNDFVRDRYNGFIANMYDDFKDLLQIHYMTKREDSEFWKYVKYELPKTEKTKYMLEMCKHRCPSSLDLDMYHGAAGWGVWCWTLIGLGYVNKETAKITLNNFSMNDESKRVYNQLNSSNLNKKYSLLSSNDFMKALWDKKIK